MKVTTRERIFLVALAMFVLVALSYFYLFQPQIKKINDLKAEAAYNLALMDSMKTELQSGNKLDEDVNSITQRVAEKTQRFFPEQLQDKLILAFDDLLNRTGTVSDSYSFGPLTLSQAPAPEAAKPVQMTAIDAARDLASQYQAVTGIAQENAPAQETPAPAAPVDATQVMFMNVKLEISGSYEGVINFVRELEKMNKAICVNDLAVTKDESGNARGSISADFYTLPLIVN